MSARPVNAPANAEEFRGIWTDPQTAAMLREFAAIAGTFYVDPIDGYGSWTDNSASGGIDNGAGHADLNLEGRTDAVCRWAETKARSLGFEAYWRPRVSSTGYVYKWQAHLHLVNKTAKGLSAAALEQIQDYYDGLNGLANKGPDTGSRAYVHTTWADYLAAKEAAMPPTPTTATLVAVPAVSIRNAPVELRAAVAPAAAGLFAFEYAGSDGKWVRFATVGAVAGKATARTTPGADATYRAIFIAAEPARFSGDYAPNVKVRVIDLAALADRVTALENTP